MAGPVTRRSDRRSTDHLAADSANNEELIIFSKLAEAIGDTLEAVCNMQERERNELITVLGLVVNKESVRTDEQACEEQSETSPDHLNHTIENELPDDSVRSVNNNTKEGSDDDLKVIAIKKRKRSSSNDINSESKRSLSFERSSKNMKVDFSKFLASKTVNTTASTSDSSATSIRAETGQERDTSVTKGDIVTINRTSVDISEFDFIKDIKSKSDKNADMEELVNVKEVGRSTDEEISIDDDDSMSLLGNPVTPAVVAREDEKPSSSNITLKVNIKSKTSSQDNLTDKEIEELLGGSDEESSNQQMNEETNLELLLENEPNETVGLKISEVHKMIIPSCVDDTQETNMLKTLFERKINHPKDVLNQDSLPTMTGEILDKKNAGADNIDRLKVLMTYFVKLDKIKSKGLVHGASSDVAWTKLTVKRNNRVKGEEKGVDLKFMATPKTEKSTANGFIDDVSSDEFDMEKDTSRKTPKNKLVSDFDTLKNMSMPSRSTTPRQKEEKSENGGWISKPSSSRAHSPPHVNRLKLPRKKIIQTLITPEKSKSEPDTDLSPGAGISLQTSGIAHLVSGQELLLGKELKTINDMDVLARDSRTNGENEAHISDDDVQIVLEVERTENTPNKQSAEASTSPDLSDNSQPVSTEEEPAGGTCPMCDKVFTVMEDLIRHCSTCQGPKEGPKLRNVGLRGRKTY